MSIITEIAKKIKPGEISYYIDRNNLKDTSTINDIKNEFESTIKNKKNWHPILEAVYKTSSSLIVSPSPSDKSGSKFIVMDPNKTSSNAFEVSIQINNNSFIIHNLVNKNKTTVFELSSVMDASKESETPNTLYDTLAEALPSYKNKSPKELKAFLYDIINN